MAKLQDDDLLFRLLEMAGTSEGGVTVAYVRLPFHKGLRPAIILERDTRFEQIKAVWTPFICQYRDMLYARQPYELKWPESFYEDICAQLETEWADVRKGKIKTGKTSYADVAEGYNRLVEADLVAHIKHRPKLQGNRNAYLEHAKSILEAFNVKDVDGMSLGEFLQNALRSIRGGLSPVQRESPIDRQKVRYIANAWKKKRERLDAVEKHG